MCFTKVTQSYFIFDNLQFKKILLHFRIIKGMPQRGQIPSCKCTTLHALGAQCNQWNVDYHIHPTVQGLNYAVRFLKTRYTCCVNIWFLLLRNFKHQNYYHYVIKIKTIN